MADPRYIIGVDVGGTFTDVMCLDVASHALKSAKVPSLPGSQWRGVLNALAELGIDYGAIDAAATAARREELRAGRVMVTLAAANEEMFDGPRREFVLSAEIARRIGVGAGGLVEITAGRGAPLRAWGRIGEGEGGELFIGPSGFAIVGAAIGETVEIRAVKRTPELT